MGTNSGEVYGAPMIPGFPAIGAAAGLVGGLFAALLRSRVADSHEAGSVSAVAAFMAVFLLIARRARLGRSLVWALAVAILLALGIVLQSEAARPPFQDFWSIVSLGGFAYLATAFAAADVAEGHALRYRAFYPAALTLPIIALGVTLFLGLGALIAYPIAKTIGSTDAVAMRGGLVEGGAMSPAAMVVGAAAAGFAIGFLRSAESFLSAVRFFLLWLARISAPLVAVGLIGLALAGQTTAILSEVARTSGLLALIAPAFIAIAVFGGVYQNGEGPPPPLWLRLSIIAILIAYPLYLSGGGRVFWATVAADGLLAKHVPAVALGVVASVHGIVGVAGLLSDIRPTGERWMPVVAPLNTLTASATLILFAGLATPFAWPAHSSINPETNIEDAAVAAEPSQQPADPEEGVMGLELNPAANPDREDMFGQDEEDPE